MYLVSNWSKAQLKARAMLKQEGPACETVIKQEPHTPFTHSYTEPLHSPKVLQQNIGKTFFLSEPQVEEFNCYINQGNIDC